MKALLIIAIIIITVSLILSLHIVLNVSYIGEELDYNVKLLGIKLYSRPKKKKKAKKKKPQNVQQKKPATEKKTEKKEPKLSDKIRKFKKEAEPVIQLVRNSGESIKYFLGHVSVTDIYVNIVVAEEDAYECAMTYAKVNILLYNILGFLQSRIKVRKKSVSTDILFNSDKSVYDISFKAKVTIGTIVVTFVKLIINFLKGSNENERKAPDRRTYGRNNGKNKKHG